MRIGDDRLGTDEWGEVEHGIVADAVFRVDGGGIGVQFFDLKNVFLLDRVETAVAFPLNSDVQRPLNKNALFGAAQPQWTFDIGEIDILRHANCGDIERSFMKMSGTVSKQESNIKPENTVRNVTVCVLFHALTFVS